MTHMSNNDNDRFDDFDTQIQSDELIPDHYEDREEQRSDTPATDTAIAILMASNMEDAAADLANEIGALRDELRRVKGIALERLERIQLKSIELERVKAIATHRLEVLYQRTTALAEIDSALSVKIATDHPLSWSALVHSNPLEMD